MLNHAYSYLQWRIRILLAAMKDWSAGRWQCAVRPFTGLYMVSPTEVCALIKCASPNRNSQRNTLVSCHRLCLCVFFCAELFRKVCFWISWRVLTDLKESNLAPVITLFYLNEKWYQKRAIIFFPGSFQWVRVKPALLINHWIIYNYFNVSYCISWFTLSGWINRPLEILHCSLSQKKYNIQPLTCDRSLFTKDNSIQCVSSYMHKWKNSI